MAKVIHAEIVGDRRAPAENRALTGLQPRLEQHHARIAHRFAVVVGHVSGNRGFAPQRENDVLRLQTGPDGN
jgi:hypothetical protein